VLTPLRLQRRKTGQKRLADGRDLPAEASLPDVGGETVSDQPGGTGQKEVNIRCKSLLAEAAWGDENKSEASRPSAREEGRFSKKQE